MNIILDTNVLVAGLRSSKGTSFRLISLINDSRLRLHVSTPLVVEYEAILKREITHLTEADIETVVDWLCAIADKHEIFFLWRPMLRDPKDDHVLELAVKAEATIVTWNLQDFIPAKSIGIQIMTPRELLEQLEKSK